jgi:hypothetical protein
LKQGFNFLKPQIEAPSIWTTIYKWVVGTARVVLIITETAVILALVIRVVIDVQGKDLDEKISNYESILKVRVEEESKYLGLQTKTSDYRNSYEKNFKYSSDMNQLIKNIPLSFSDIDISIVSNKINLKGKAPITDIKKFEQFLKSSQVFTNSSLNTFNVGENKDTNQLSDFDFITNFSNLPKRQLFKDNTITDNEYIYD